MPREKLHNTQTYKSLICMLRRSCKKCKMKNDKCRILNNKIFKGYSSNLELLSADAKKVGNGMVLSVSYLIPPKEVLELYEVIEKENLHEDFYSE